MGKSDVWFGWWQTVSIHTTFLLEAPIVFHKILLLSVFIALNCEITPWYISRLYYGLIWGHTIIKFLFLIFTVYHFYQFVLIFYHTVTVPGLKLI